jgi:hypothetical protein
MQRFGEVDAANIAAVLSTLPETPMIEDPHSLAEVLDISHLESWTEAVLRKVPDHIKRGLGRITLAPIEEAVPYAHQGKQYRPHATYRADSNTVILYVNKKAIEERIQGIPGDLFDDEYESLIRELQRFKAGDHLVHETMHFDHCYKAPIRTLVEWGNVVSSEGEPLDWYTAHAAAAEIPLDSDCEEYAVAGTMYFDTPNALRRRGTGARYHVIDRRMRGDE